MRIIRGSREQIYAGMICTDEHITASAKVDEIVGGLDRARELIASCPLFKLRDGYRRGQFDIHCSRVGGKTMLYVEIYDRLHTITPLEDVTPLIVE